MPLITLSPGNERPVEVDSSSSNKDDVREEVEAALKEQQQQQQPPPLPPAPAGGPPIGKATDLLPDIILRTNFRMGNKSLGLNR